MHLDEDIQIENLSKIQIRSKESNDFLNLNFKLSSNNTIATSKENEENTNESIVCSVNPSDLNSQLKAPVDHNSTINLINNQISNNLVNLETTTNNNFEIELNDDQPNEFDEKTVDNLVWSENDVSIMLECCRQFNQESSSFAYYNVNVDLTYLEYDDMQLWQQIARLVKAKTSKSFNDNQCKTKFFQLRTTYINIKAYSPIESTYFGQLKYYANLKHLIDGLKPCDDLIQLNNQSKLRAKERGKDRFKDKNINTNLALLQQIKAYSRQFNENSVPKQQIWMEIANHLNNQGYNFSGKSCQGLFHRLRYTYLHLLKTIANEMEGNRWPYFAHFQEINLTPFTSKRRPKKAKNGDEAGDEEFEEDEDNEFDNFDDNSQPNDNFEFDNSSKRIKSS